MKKAACAKFENILNTIHEKGITTRAELMTNQALYADFWFAAEEFASFALRSKTSGKNSEGEILPGNTYKLDTLVRRGITTREDVERDCFVKIVDRLDLVLCQPIEKQKNYCYTICNNIVKDWLRKLPDDDIKIVQIDGPVKGNNAEEDDSFTYKDVIADNTYNGEEILMAHETVAEKLEKLKAKRVQSRETIIKEIKHLNKRPAEVLVRIAMKHLGMKPRELASHIANKGEEVTYAEILIKVAKKNDIELEELRKVVKGNSIPYNSIKSETQDIKEISSQVSRLAWRAENNLKK